MKRNVVVLAVVLSLLVVLSSTVGVMADKGGVPNEHGQGEGRGGAPHDGGCVAYCARAWADRDNDGKTESCLLELKCHKALDDDGNPICPLVDSDGDGIPDVCVLGCVTSHGPVPHP